jgi:hypothetical protein
VLKINPPVPANAVVATCARLVDSLPNVLEGLNSRVVSPRSPLVHAWGDRPVVVRCGVPKPADYDPNSPSTTVVNGVSWFQAIGTKIVTWTAVRKTANIELSVPTSYDEQGKFLVDIGSAISATLP